MPLFARQNSRVRPVFLAAGAGALALAAWKLSDFLAGASAIADAASEEAITAGQEISDEAYKLVFPSQAQPYADIILDVARSYSLSPLIVTALGTHESNWGQSLTPPGPGGTGDFTHRTWTPWAMPPDGLGWGRGLMQIDYYYFQSWIAANDWRDPETNIDKGVSELKKHLAFFAGSSKLAGITDGYTVTISSTVAKNWNSDPGQYIDPRPLSGDDLLAAGIAAYNGGDAGVLRALALGFPADKPTTGNNYSSSILANVATMQARLA